jgi:hypothetical protein
LRSCVDPVLFYETKPILIRKGTISIRKTNSLDYTYLGYRSRADQRVAPMWRLRLGIAIERIKHPAIRSQTAVTNSFDPIRDLESFVRVQMRT